MVIGNRLYATEQSIEQGTGGDRRGPQGTAGDITGQGRAGQGRAGQHRAGQDRAAQGSTAQGSTGQHSTAQHRAAQHSTAQHSTAQHSTAQHSTAQHSTAQHSTAQHSTAQHSTAQHSTQYLLTGSWGSAAATKYSSRASFGSMPAAAVKFNIPSLRFCNMLTAYQQQLIINSGRNATA